MKIVVKGEAEAPTVEQAQSWLRDHGWVQKSTLSPRVDCWNKGSHYAILPTEPMWLSLADYTQALEVFVNRVAAAHSTTPLHIVLLMRGEA